MRINVTLGGALIRYLPPEESGNRFVFTHDGELTLEDLLARLGIGREQRLLTILNGQVIQSNVFATTLLADGDALSLMPPIVAG